MRLPRSGFAFGLLSLVLFGAPAAAPAQTGPRIIDTLQPAAGANALPPERAAPNPATIPSLPAAHAAPNAGAAAKSIAFVLRRVRVDGAAHVDAAAVAALWRPLVGKTVTLDDLKQLAEAISALYRRAGFALYTVSLPNQTFRDGIAVLRVSEGYVAAVSIDDAGNAGDAELIRAYGAKIAADRPLRQDVLERYILLMGDLPGYIVGSRFEVMPGEPGAYKLVLSVRRKPLDAGFSASNVGIPLLSNSQLEVDGVANGLLRDGDRTQLAYGFPPDAPRNYRYVGLTHQTPLGDDGMTLQLSGGYLTTHTRTGAEGRAFLLGAHINEPLIRSVRQSLYLNLGVDALNSDNALVNASLSDERTRAGRATVSYALQDAFDGVDIVVATLSAGIPGLGARRDSIVFGGPGFAKLNARIERAQQLPLGLVLRLRAVGQMSGGHLPASEEFAYGGEDFGRAFDYDTLNGDRGVAASGEVAYQAGPFQPLDVTLRPELFVFADWGKIWNANTQFLPRTDRAASAGIGARATIAERTALSADLARTVERPLFARSPAGWRIVISLRRTI